MTVQEKRLPAFTSGGTTQRWDELFECRFGTQHVSRGFNCVFLH